MLPAPRINDMPHRVTFAAVSESPRSQILGRLVLAVFCRSPRASRSRHWRLLSLRDLFCAAPHRPSCYECASGLRCPAITLSKVFRCKLAWEQLRSVSTKKTQSQKLNPNPLFRLRHVPDSYRAAPHKGTFAQRANRTKMFHVKHFGSLIAAPLSRGKHWFAAMPWRRYGRGGQARSRRRRARVSGLGAAGEPAIQALGQRRQRRSSPALACARGVRRVHGSPRGRQPPPHDGHSSGAAFQCTMRGPQQAADQNPE